MLARLDRWLRRRSLFWWVGFRIFAGLLVATGLFAWLSVWFERNFWLGVAQAVMCVGVLANELGLLRGKKFGRNRNSEPL